MNTNVNIKIVIGSRPVSDGKYGIYLRIVKNRKKKEISLGIRCKSEHFSNEQLSKKHRDYKVDNEVILNFKSKALAVIREFQLSDYDFSLEEFEAKFRGIENKPKKINAISFFDEIITELELSDRLGNAKVYKEAKSTLIKFAGKNILFEQITPEFLEKFEVFMRSRGNKDSGIAFRMRELRALFNTAIRRKLIPRELYPFEEYKISRLKTKKNKRALTLEDFKKIKEVDLSKRPDLWEAHNYFMFSVYTRGMNFVDMMKLKWENIKDGRIYYTRSKTKGQFNIEVTEKVQEILNYYKVQNRPTSYVFPILLQEDLTAIQMDNRRHKVLARCNRKLKEIAKIAGIDKVLTTYVARHSFATLLKQMGTSTDKISELMGHSDVQVTMTYLKEFDTEALDIENRKLLDL